MFVDTMGWEGKERRGKGYVQLCCQLGGRRMFRGVRMRGAGRGISRGGRSWRSCCGERGRVCWMTAASDSVGSTLTEVEGQTV